MTKKNSIEPSLIKEGIRQTARYIATNLAAGDGYCSQRSALERLFKMTSGSDYTRNGILLRLSTLDAMYSTNARMANYALEELASAIWDNGNKHEHDVMDRLLKVLNGDIIITDPLFEAKFGWQKNKRAERTLPSLVSKYAYYQALTYKSDYYDGFPIYDDLVCQVLPACVDGCSTAALRKDTSLFFAKISELRTKLKLKECDLHGLQPYDAMDAYLWRIGKLYSGNISLLVDVDDYKKAMDRICPLEVKGSGDEEEKFYRVVKSHYPKQLFKGMKNEKLLNTLYKHYKKIYEKEEQNG